MLNGQMAKLLDIEWMGRWITRAVGRVKMKVEQT